MTLYREYETDTPEQAAARKKIQFCRERAGDAELAVNASTFKRVFPELLKAAREQANEIAGEAAREAYKAAYAAAEAAFDRGER